MNVKEIKQVVQKYFEGETTLEEERMLEAYFQSEEIEAELKEYAEFFGGISELADETDDREIEDDVMNFILENEHREKTKYRSLWKTVTGIAASIIIILGGFLFYQQQQAPFKDTFDDPDKAYEYAQQTLRYVSSKYNKGLAELSNFDKLEAAKKPLKEGITPVNKFFDTVEKIEKTENQ